jgi:hypothetical protein
MLASTRSISACCSSSTTRSADHARLWGTVLNVGGSGVGPLKMDDVTKGVSPFMLASSSSCSDGVVPRCIVAVAAQAAIDATDPA